MAFPVFIHSSDSTETTTTHSHLAPIVEKQHFQEGAELATFITNILNSEELENLEVISVYDIVYHLHKLKIDYEGKRKKYQSSMQSKIRVLNSDYWLYIEGMNEEGLCISVHDSLYSVHCFWINKSGNDFYINKYRDNFSNLQKVFGIISEKIPEVFDFEKDYQEKKKNNKINATNNEFYIEFSIDELVIKILEYPDFSVHAELNSLDNNIKGNSMRLLQILQGREFELFKKIFIQITDCPIWLQEDLYEIRKNQLEDKERKKQEEEKQRLKKERRREFLKKIFPFIK